MSQAGQFYRSSLINTLTGDAGGAVGPTAGNIDFVGAGGLTITGNPATSTLTFTIGGGIPATFTTDAGNAAPAAGVLNVLGGTNINTTGAGNTVTVILDDDVTLAGSLTAGTTLEATTTITAGTGLTVTTGNATVSTGDVIVTTGDITVSGGDITVSSGGIAASSGDVFAGNDLEAVGTVTFQSLTDGILLGDGFGELSAINGTDGQVIIATTGGAPAFADLTAGVGIAITQAAGSITINATTGGFTWTEVVGTTQAMSVNNGYIPSNVALVTLTLPATGVLGDSIQIVGKGAGGWRVAQNAGQTIHYSSLSTTPGVGGRLDSTHQRDCIELVCVTANTDWQVVDGVGNITVT